ncbi:hypothetical protein [Variovorax sp. YR752]|uniref:hypothetical protein n=1 Tax=Variovorax sp. YR752 TaxID=1884383 RepID=UPI0031383086
MGRTAIVDNMPGAGSTLGAADVARSIPDGQTLLTWALGTCPHLIAAALARSTGADLNIVACKGSAPAVQELE